MAEQTHGSECCNHQVAVPFVTHKRLGVFSCLLVFLSFTREQQERVKKKKKKRHTFSVQGKLTVWRHTLVNNKFVFKRFGVITSSLKEEIFLEENPAVEFE